MHRLTLEERGGGGLGLKNPKWQDKIFPLVNFVFPTMVTLVWGAGGGGVARGHGVGLFPSAAPIGLSPLHILTLSGSERVLAVSTEPLDDLSCLTTPGGRLSQRRGCCPCR